MQSSNSTVIRTEFAAAISQIAKERKIDVESIYEAIVRLSSRRFVSNMG